ncbi:hypothetical protein BO78DRAFT_35031 [Aspergillus sclerotiicarbonarius CBS 121057]|uniref:Uncharacterized protein n=1 Tax=Aspergillus sclerotiicarbonarius (strain CBS 121057 / IBT 28362) TaxID=1448318 RepID=A0A319DTH5_ASPSB|nr:hypothetical protein BO78DRAFT_35031 [Aspergillus sclerotiicarbonarius CBS 121057]
MPTQSFFLCFHLQALISVSISMLVLNVTQDRQQSHLANTEVNEVTTVNSGCRLDRVRGINRVIHARLVDHHLRWLASSEAMHVEIRE